MLVKVAIDLALDRLFTYEVPAEFWKKLAVGQLLSVPFGRRMARGFALEIAAGAFPAPAEGDYTLRPIAAIIDEVPFFGAHLLTLVRQIAAYTAAPIESVLRAAVPAAVLKPNAHAKEQLYVAPAASAIPPSAPSAGHQALTARQQWLCEQIVRLDGGWMQPLCRELKTTPASLRLLAARGLVTIEPQVRRRAPLAGRVFRPSRPLPLNPAQSAALALITSPTSPASPHAGISSPQPVLLHGITGSGKTEVYLQAIAAELAQGRGAIVMVPEIALTPQTVQRFASRFGDRIAVLHSALSDGERYDEWHRIRNGEAQVVIGPRSAVFAPVRNLGLIVVDEEHETSYKQEDTPRYNARDVAVMRGRIEGAKVVLGSATPSLETWANVAKGKYARATMGVRAGAGRLPYVAIADMEEERQRAGHAVIFSQRLLEAIGLRLDRAEQVMLFLNRRGYSRQVTCGTCGCVLTCPDCDLAYTYHQADDCCRCHICGGWIPTPQACPECKARTLSYKGVGTQRAEEALKRCFPRARVLRMDADSTGRRHAHEDILGAFGRHEADILIGTQMIAKGLDFPNVTLVGILNADSSLNMPDFRAAERSFQLFAQVAGRAGRAELPGEVFIQTYDPESPTIRAAARGDFEGFARTELAVRRELGYPPFRHLSVVSLSSRSLPLVGEWAAMYAQSLQKVRGLEVGDAIPGVLAKAEGWYRWQITILAQSVALTVKSWRWLLGVRPPPKDLRLSLDVDAFNLL
ncbi:MAG: primosomal protein N' [Kiritimatiellia bacterium]